MHPTLLEIGTLKFHAYPTMLAVAFITCVLLGVREANRGPDAFPGTPIGGLCGFVGALLGAKAFWILQYSEPKYLWHVFLIYEGGLVYYGGLIGGVLGVLLYLRVTRLPYWLTADIAAPYLALGQAITRIGCFLNGCCWGHAAEGLPWAVTFGRHSPAFTRQVEEGLLHPSAAAPLPVHPTQLYMVAGLLAIALVLKLGLGRDRPFHGAVGLAYCFLYGLLRFIVETFRGDSARSVFGLSVSQMISLALILGSVATYLVVIHQMQRRTPAAVEGPEQGAEGEPEGEAEDEEE